MCCRTNGPVAFLVFGRKKRISNKLASHPGGFMLDTLFKVIFWASLPLQLVAAIYLVKPLLVLLVYPWRKHRLQVPAPAQGKERDFAAIVTAHGDARFIAPLVDSLLKQAHQRHVVYVVADECDVSDLRFDPAQVVVLQPAPPLHSKIRSIRHALDHLVREPDVVVVFDADNLVHPQYLVEVNRLFNAGYRAVMGHIRAKKPQGSYAQLDSAGEIYTNFMYRKASMALGCSSNIDGKGLAVDYQVYKTIDYQHLLGGFDKKVQADLALKVPQIAYADTAYVYDEKIPDAGALRKQRTRWINAYFKYFGLNARVLAHALATLNLRLAYFGLNLLQPPLFLVIGAGIGGGLLSLVWGWPALFAWGVALSAFLFSIPAVLWLEGAGMAVWRAAFKVPNFIWQQLLAMFKMKKANKSFMRTEHHQVLYIDDVLPQADLPAQRNPPVR
jgi:cellulose synthase/poly-beta-1,6-N-acetylglucosamine synthase-like glycosyltransferase